MWRLLVTMRQKLQNMGKSPRVVDENKTNICGGRRSTRQHNWIGFSIICGVFRAPLALFSCINHLEDQHGGWSLGFWRIFTNSEMNHLMVSDSMRYAILM
ncbi:hypothetical protein HAX54_020580 [Datura stramonium]|uniref:Uncharacterized protein n=1 Tax=Datura stramonium TaxID=4076 RepID=A0ABS8URC1_DATST|nr:hypothetical protein [Datura stramonium]